MLPYAIWFYDVSTDGYLERCTRKETKMILGLLVPVLFAAIVMRALHGWLMEESTQITPEESMKPQAKAQKAGE